MLLSLRSSFLLLIFFMPLYLIGQDANTIWADKNEDSILPVGARVINPTVYRTVSVDTSSLKSTIFQAPHEFGTPVKDSETILSIPLPNGTSKDFHVVLYTMMESDLTDQYPEIKTGYGVSTGKDQATIRFDWTYRGFHALVRTSEETVFIDPFSLGDKSNYVSYFKKDYPAPETLFECHVEAPSVEDISLSPVEKSGDCVFRSYRLAMATTGEYSNFHGANNSSQSGLVQSAVTTTINRVNDVYERDLTIRLILINNTDKVFFYDGNTDPYSNDDGGAMLNQNKATLNDSIGVSNYDIGHVFSTGGGGIAALNGPCGGNKAKGVTGSGNPVGDPFDIDYVCHEMGHQFGADHTQNNDCNRNGPTAMEPGSASTIMGYAGVCAPNVQSNSDDYFHAISLQEIGNFVSSGNGDNCDLQRQADRDSLQMKEIYV